MKNIRKITFKILIDDILPARLIAYRKSGSVVTAGDKTIISALITLFTLLTGKQLSSKDIRKLIKKYHIRVAKEVRSVL